MDELLLQCRHALTRQSSRGKFRRIQITSKPRDDNVLQKLLKIRLKK